MIFDLIFFAFITLNPVESLLQDFKYKVNFIYLLRLSKKIPPPALVKEAEDLFKELKKALPGEYSLQNGFSWSKGPDYFLGKISEKGNKESIIITGEKIRFNYVIYDEIIIPFFENADRYDGTVIKAWIAEDGTVNVLRKEYYREAEKIWNGDVLSPFAKELFMKEYKDIINLLKKRKDGLQRFKTVYFRNETSDMCLPEETFHIEFPDICEKRAEVLARLHRLWFNPTYSFVANLIISAGKLSSPPTEKWVERAGAPHRFSARWILYTIFKHFQISSYRTLTEIPLESLSSLAEKEFFDEISMTKGCFPFK